MVKSLPAVQETWARSLSREDPLKKEMGTPVLLPGKFHGWRSLVGYSPRGGKEPDMAESLTSVHDYRENHLLSHLVVSGSF